MIKQVSILLVLITLLSLNFYTLSKTDHLRKLYKHDERWHQMKLRSDTIVRRYYEWVLVIVALSGILQSFLPQPILFSLEHVSMLFTSIFMLAQVVEYVAIKRLDKIM